MVASGTVTNGMVVSAMVANGTAASIVPNVRSAIGRKAGRRVLSGKKWPTRIRPLPNSRRSKPSWKPVPRNGADLSGADLGAAKLAAGPGSDRQRIDRWLWHARVVRTREDAASLTGAGYVRVNGARIDAPGRMVRAGDVITIALDHGVRVLKVTGFVERRGPGGTGVTLYEALDQQRAP
jgi:ribosome-associated heat shock protein Hsp15